MVETFVQSTDDVVKFLKGQHNLIKDMFDDVLSASSTEAREKSFIALRQLLAVHETAEEMVVHPRARREIADGDAVVDARLHEEHVAKEHLSKLEGMDIGSKAFIDELTKFRDAVVDHAEHEENEEFSKLQRKLDAEDSQAAWRQPYRPPRPLRRPVRTPAWSRRRLNFAVGPFASMLDRARDVDKAGHRLAKFSLIRQRPPDS